MKIIWTRKRGFMVFVAIYLNKENELCTVLKEDDYTLYKNNGKYQCDFVNIMQYVADDFLRFIEINKTQIKLSEHDIQTIDERCNCSHAFINDLKRFGYNVSYPKDEY